MAVRALLLSGALFMLAACSGPPEGPAPSEDQATARMDGGAEDKGVEAGEPGARPKTIAWYAGSVEEAFAAATDEGKPVFLYWSAEWCPPCHQLKVTLFRDRAFIDRSTLFIPIYLDGDTDEGQRHADRFGIVGYPTMLVLEPNGSEIMRIAGGIDVAAYSGILDATLADGSPVPELIAQAMAGESFSERDCRLAAYYPWESDQLGLLERHDPSELFPSLAAACPESMAAERSRLFMASAVGLSMAKQAGAAAPVEGLAEQLADVLGEYELVKANIAVVLSTAGLVVGSLSEAETEGRTGLAQAWSNALDVIDSDESLSKMERIYTNLARVDLARLDDPDGPLPAALINDLKEKAVWADETTPNPNERQTVMNAVANTFWNAELYEPAREVLKKELSISKQPYYFTLSLAELEQDAGNGEEALIWFERAYDESRGKATRFQWGYNYLVGLLDISPEDSSRIQQESIRVFGELKDNAADAFYQRTFQRVEQLETRFLEWNEAGDHTESLKAIRNGVMDICRTIPESEQSRANCESFLDQV